MVSHFDSSKLRYDGFKVLVEDREVILPDGSLVKNGFQFRNLFRLHPFARDKETPPNCSILSEVLIRSLLNTPVRVYRSIMLSCSTRTCVRSSRKCSADNLSTLVREKLLGGIAKILESVPSNTSRFVYKFGLGASPFFAF
eukprot:CFRG8668